MKSSRDWERSGWDGDGISVVGIEEGWMRNEIGKGVGSGRVSNLDWGVYGVGVGNKAWWGANLGGDAAEVGVGWGHDGIRMKTGWGSDPGGESNQDEIAGGGELELGLRLWWERDRGGDQNRIGMEQGGGAEVGRSPDWDGSGVESESRLGWDQSGNDAMSAVPHQQCHVSNSAMSATVPRQQCHSATSTVPRQQCPATMTGSALGMPGQLANESITEYRQRFEAQLALIEAEEQRQLAAEAVRLQAEAAATVEKQRLQAEAEADTQAHRKEAQDLLQRHEATRIEKLKFWHFEPSEGHDDATPEEQHKEFLAKLVTRLVCTCNHLQSELAILRRGMQSHKDLHEDATRALHSRVQDLEQVAPRPNAGETSSAPSTRQLEERVDHVVAMLGDISTFAAPATINNQLDTLKTEVQQLHQLPNNTTQHYKMPTFQIEKFDDYTHQDPVIWWEGFTTQLRILFVPKHLYIGALFLNSKGECQIWLSHLATVHGVDVTDPKDKISWEELTRLWKKRFIVDDAPTLAINRLFAVTQGNTSTRDWLMEWQKIAATPDLELPFSHLRREFYNRSCAALSLALGDREQYATFAEIIDKAREIIETNRAAAHEKSAWQPTYVEKGKFGPRPQHVAAVHTDNIVEDPAATQASREGDQGAVVQLRSNNKSRGNGKAKTASPAGNGQPAPWVKFHLTEAEYNEDHPVNFYRRTVHVRDWNGVVVPCTVPPPHPWINCHVVSAASMRASIIRDDIEEMGVCFLQALPPHDASSTDSSSDPRITEFLDVYGDVSEGPHGVVPDRPIRHEIILEDGAVPPRGCIYRMSEEELSVLRVQLDDLLEKGWIRPSSLPYGAPVLFVRKKNKDLRLCIDYRKLNTQTVKNAGPLPRIDDLLERLGGAKFFSKLDLKSGYHELESRQEDRYKTAFKTQYGHFEWLVMAFGLTNAPATFQAAMTTEFRHMLDRFVLIYLDDILVYSRSLDKHVEHLRTVLERLRQAKYKANRDKCEFARQELEYLGHYVTPQGIRPLADKIEAICVWPEPTNTTDIRSFMGLAGYYQRFITGYSRIGAPMTRLQSPKVSFVFDDDARRSFQALKTAMLMAPVLSIYDPTLPTRVTTDASGYGIGAVLEQHDNDEWHPVEYFSHKVPPINSLDDARRNESLEFTWVTDNNPLTYYKTQDMADLEKKHIDLIRSYAHDLRDVQEIFNRQKDTPCINKNSPPYSGAVYWVRGLVARIQEPMEKLRQLNKMITEIEEAKEIIKLFNTLISQMADYERNVVESWTKEVEATSEDKLKQPLLRRESSATLLRMAKSAMAMLTPGSAVPSAARASFVASVLQSNDRNPFLRVNFDPALVRLLREVKYFLLLEVQVPDSSQKIFKRAEIFRQQTGNLELIVNMYNGILMSLMEVEKPLVEKKMSNVDAALAKGLQSLNWNSHKIEDYVTEVMSMLKDLSQVLQSLKSNVKRTQSIVDRWATHLLIDRKEGKVYSVEDFTESHKTLTTSRNNDITEGGLEIHRLLATSNKILKVWYLLSTW
ncbi:hypothetical protein CBR_g49350 [Chara braunii]|uniref:Reverse transcriptase domain-containing protein n=1 Tax=Chara braunii TaxID=69332 RepID=A0A388M4T5_CHABU|nr:hypothetical protein CBR_g49350 [Chara braunii]|eukprot:GBG89561.1 hypothetical protein CBR_g49350 [Chara braunii]